jgi:hypothetical protein
LLPCSKAVAAATKAGRPTNLGYVVTAVPQSFTIHGVNWLQQPPNAHDTLTSIVFIHGITSATALGHLLPHLSEANRRAALRYA